MFQVDSATAGDYLPSPTSPAGSSSQMAGIFVKHVLPDSPAGRTGQLFTGDRLLEISGVRLTSSDHTVAVQAIRAAPDPVRFVVQSLQQGMDGSHSPRTPMVSEKIFFKKKIIPSATKNDKTKPCTEYKCENVFDPF